MIFNYLDNLRGRTMKSTDDLRNVDIAPTPKFKKKADFREWSADPKTKSCFYTLFEGSSPLARVTSANPVRLLKGLVADYDTHNDWQRMQDKLRSGGFRYPPTFITKTFSGWMRFIWVFEKPIPIDPRIVPYFFAELKKIIKHHTILNGYDKNSDLATQYFHIGEDVQEGGGIITHDICVTALLKAASKANFDSDDTLIPMSVLEKEVHKRFPDRWMGPFEEGSRGALFWVPDGVDREGCEIFAEGVYSYSDRCGGFLTWRDIFGSDFVQAYEQQKVGAILDEYWFNGRQFFKLLDGAVKCIPRDQLYLELKQRGFNSTVKKGRENISELQNTILLISNTNRVDLEAPIYFRRSQRIVESGGYVILNTSQCSPIKPASEGDPTKFKFIDKFIKHTFTKEALPYALAHAKVQYESALYEQLQTGQAVILVGKASRGKTLYSNAIIGGLMGGHADASDFVQGRTKFNKNLADCAQWVTDDSTVAASFSDKRLATETLKRIVANARVSYMPKHVDAVDLEWSGRVYLTCNEDANSLQVIPTLDSSNADKIMAFTVNSEQYDFPPREKLALIIQEELPYFAKYLLEYTPPKEVIGDNRYIVRSYLDPKVAQAAYENSSKALVAETVDSLCVAYREHSPSAKEWVGTTTDLQSDIQKFHSGRHLGASSKLEFLRVGLANMEENKGVNPDLRPVSSTSKGGGKVWHIDVSEVWDICPKEEITSALEIKEDLDL